MLDTTLQDRCRRFVDSKISERRKILESELRKIDSGCVPNDSLDQFYQLIISEFKTRSTIAWQEMEKSHKILGSAVNSKIGDDFKQELYNYIREAFLELNFKIQGLRKKSINAADCQLDEVQDQIVKKYNQEIDRYVDSLTK